VLKVTNGRGCDVVLNSLAGVHNIQAGLKSLAAGGRFVEIGKVDVYGGTQLGLTSFARNIQYTVVALDMLLFNKYDFLVLLSLVLFCIYFEVIR
jgi:NADPH:quinone reductase-like Zn-dependent oxidoreductase